MKSLSYFLPAVAAASFASSAIAQVEHNMDHSDHIAQMTEAAGACALPMGAGVINAIDVPNAKLNLTHEPIKMLSWEEMTMDFSVAKIVDLAAFYQGEKVHFMLRPEKNDAWSIAMICSLEIEMGAHMACMEAMGKEQARIAAELDEACEDAAPDMGGHHGHH